MKTLGGYQDFLDTFVDILWQFYFVITIIHKCQLVFTIKIILYNLACLLQMLYLLVYSFIQKYFVILVFLSFAYTVKKDQVPSG